MCLGNGRMISRWPARGGPMVWDNTVYYAAGIWPSEGVYVHALDAASGRVHWTNDRAGNQFMPQPHGGANAASGVAAQGYLLATEDRLFVPTGRAVPAAFRGLDGELEYYRLQDNGSIGGARALLADRFAINGGCFLETADGSLAARGGRGVFSVLPDGILQFDGSTLLAYRWGDAEAVNRKGQQVRYRGLAKYSAVELGKSSDEVRRAEQVVAGLSRLKNLFQTEIVFRDVDDGIPQQTGLERVLAQSRPDVERLGADVAVPGRCLRTHQRGDRRGKRSDLRDAGPRVDRGSGLQRVRWSRDVDGDAVGLAAAHGWLLVSTTSGALYAFAEPAAGAAADGPSPPTPLAGSPAAVAEESTWGQAAQEILEKTGITAGICLDLGCSDGQLALELVRGPICK